MSPDSSLRKVVTVGVLLTLAAGLIAGALQPLLMSSAPASVPQVAYTVPNKADAPASGVALMPDALPSMAPQTQRRDLEQQHEAESPRLKKTPECQAVLASAQAVLKGDSSPDVKQSRLNSLHQQALKRQCL